MNYGLPERAQQPAATPPAAAAPPPPPATASDLRAALAVVDGHLKTLSGGGYFGVVSRRDAINALLDVRAVLDRMTAPSALIAMAVEINDANRALREAWSASPNE